jgi:hypothetical protein
VQEAQLRNREKSFQETLVVRVLGIEVSMATAVAVGIAKLKSGRREGVGPMAAEVELVAEGKVVFPSEKIQKGEQVRRVDSTVMERLTGQIWTVQQEVGMCRNSLVERTDWKFQTVLADQIELVSLEFDVVVQMEPRKYSGASVDSLMDSDRLQTSVWQEIIFACA